VLSLLCRAAAAEDKVTILTPSRMREWVLRGEDDWVVSTTGLLARSAQLQQHNTNLGSSSTMLSSAGSKHRAKLHTSCRAASSGLASAQPHQHCLRQGSFLFSRHKTAMLRCLASCNAQQLPCCGLCAAAQVFFYTENHAGSIASAPAFVEVAHK
jgi:hypothetical protein